MKSHGENHHDSFGAGINAQRLLSAKGAALLLNLHPQTVYDMAAAGTLPSFKIGRSRKFDIRSLEQWIEKMKAEGL